MSDLPKVGVIIPVYNREKFIRETIESVLAQTYTNIEIVAVDDGSIDNSRKILEKYKDRIWILEHPGGENKGQSAAINLGLKFSESEYVAILDSDDLFAPDKIMLQVDYLERHPDIGLVYGNGWAINEYGKKLYKFYDSSHREVSEPSRVLLDCYFFLPGNALLRRIVFDKAGMFDEELRSAQDHDMAIRVSEVSKIAYINKEIFYYRRHLDSISEKKAKLRWMNGFKILEKAKNRYPYSRSVIRHRKAVLHFRLGQCYVEENNFIVGLAHFSLAGLLDPIRTLKVVLKRENITGLH